MNAFFEKKLYLFLFSIILVFGSVFGNNETPVKQIFTEFNFFETLDLLATKESFFRTPDTFLRSSVFFLSIITMLLSFILKSSNTNILSTTLRNIITTLPLVFFLTILTTDNFYNAIALLLVTLSIYYTIFYAKRSFHRHEIILISSYILILIYPFYNSLLHEEICTKIFYSY